MTITQADEERRSPHRQGPAMAVAVVTLLLIVPTALVSYALISDSPIVIADLLMVAGPRAEVSEIQVWLGRTVTFRSPRSRAEEGLESFFHFDRDWSVLGVRILRGSRITHQIDIGAIR